MASLCHPWFTTTNLSYRFPIVRYYWYMTIYVYIFIYRYTYTYIYNGVRIRDRHDNSIGLSRVSKTTDPELFIPLDPIPTMTSTRKHLVEILPLAHGWSNPYFFTHEKNHGLFVCKDHAWLKFVCKFREVFPWFRAHKARRIANKRDNPIPIGKAAIIQLKKT